MNKIIGLSCSVLFLSGVAVASDGVLHDANEGYDYSFSGEEDISDNGEDYSSGDYTPIYVETEADILEHKLRIEADEAARQAEEAERRARGIRDAPVHVRIQMEMAKGEMRPSILGAIDQLSLGLRKIRSYEPDIARLKESIVDDISYFFVKFSSRLDVLPGRGICESLGADLSYCDQIKGSLDTLIDTVRRNPAFAEASACFVEAKRLLSQACDRLRRCRDIVLKAKEDIDAQPQ
ncbi:MAG: hypothetical protein LBQ43_00440 [Holosporales bacterium]|nr:hypothetical protein [Holosporales bacterium]